MYEQHFRIVTVILCDLDQRYFLSPTIVVFLLLCLSVRNIIGNKQISTDLDEISRTLSIFLFLFFNI